MVGRPNAFEVGVTNHQTLTQVQPLEKELFLTSITSLEKNGSEMLGAGKIKAQRFGEAMHQLYLQAADLELVPPLTQKEKERMAGKVATFGALREAEAPKAPRKKPSDTSRAQTDKRKP